MIRSPISSEERLRNRVEEAEKRNSDLEHRVTELETTLMKSFEVLFTLIRVIYRRVDSADECLIAHGETLDEQEERLVFLDGEVGTLLKHAGIL